jgi:hypothetical protein
MNFLTWNIAFWERTDKKNKTEEEIKEWKNFAGMLIQRMDFDFILLQEVNPYFIYDEKYKIEDGPVHFFKTGNKNIYYHELLEVLPKEGYNLKKDDLWGAAIIAHEKYTLLKKYFYSIELKYIGENYWGYETLMCYDFKLNDERIITIINFYKKGKAYYSSIKDFKTAYAYDRNFFLIFQK